MFRNGFIAAIVGLLFSIPCNGQAIKPAKQAKPAKATHILQPVLLEVAATTPSGDAWDSGIGVYTRPDPQVTIMRHDELLLRELTELVVSVRAKQFEELGRPLPPSAKALLGRSAIQSLRCGATIEALQDNALIKSRARQFADTQVANDSVLTKLTGCAMPIADGDTVTIFVNDIDVAAHDLMGEMTLEIDKELLGKGELDLKFHSVESLRLKIAPVTD